MGKFKKGNVQPGAKLVNAKVSKDPLTTLQKKGTQKGIGKINPKKHSVKLPQNIKDQVKKNNKSILEKTNLDQVVAVKTSINKNQKGKLPTAGVQNGKGKGDKKELKNENRQIKATNNVPVNKPQNKEKKADLEDNSKHQLGPVSKLPVPPSPQNRGKKQNPIPKKKPVIVPGDGNPTEVLKKQKQKKNYQKAVSSSLQQKFVKRQKDEEIEDEGYDLEQVFDEAMFNEVLKKETVTKIVEALKGYATKQVEQKKNQIFSDYKYILDVTCFKIPHCPKRMVKLKLKHSVKTDDDEVCLFVKDLQRGMRVDYEPTIHHYEDLLREKGVKEINTIMPFNQLKKEYGSYEMKAKLANTYEYFLCDGAIVGNVIGFLGKTFRNARCAPRAVRFTTKNLAHEIKKALHKTSYKQGAKGCMISIPVAHHKMSTKSVVENILDVISQLKKVYPGGLPNIRNIFVRVNVKGTSSLPLYVSLVAPKRTPIVIGPKEEILKKQQQAAKGILEKFDLTLSGEILGKRQIEDNNENIEEEPNMKKKKKEKPKKLIDNAKKQNNEKKQVQKDTKLAEKKSGKAKQIEDGLKEKLLKEIEIVTRQAEVNEEDDEEESDENENVGDEDAEDGSVEEGSDVEESDEAGSDDDDEEGNEEESDALEYDSDDESTDDIGGASKESEDEDDE